MIVSFLVHHKSTMSSIDRIMKCDDIFWPPWTCVMNHFWNVRIHYIPRHLSHVSRDPSTTLAFCSVVALLNVWAYSCPFLQIYHYFSQIKVASFWRNYPLILGWLVTMDGSWGSCIKQRFHSFALLQLKSLACEDRKECCFEHPGKNSFLYPPMWSFFLHFGAFL